MRSTVMNIGTRFYASDDPIRLHNVLGICSIQKLLNFAVWKLARDYVGHATATIVSANNEIESERTLPPLTWGCTRATPAPAIVLFPDTSVGSEHVFDGQRIRFGISVDVHVNAFKNCGFYRC